jgi:serine/threonine protein kinase HipA of HipAB toxin-antitoxin module
VEEPARSVGGGVAERVRHAGRHADQRVRELMRVTAPRASSPCRLSGALRFGASGINRVNWVGCSLARRATSSSSRGVDAARLATTSTRCSCEASTETPAQCGSPSRLSHYGRRRASTRGVVRPLIGPDRPADIPIGLGRSLGAAARRIGVKEWA